MAQYINKSALVAEIERRLKELAEFPKLSYEIGLIDAYMIMRAFLETLEVKEVNIADMADEYYYALREEAQRLVAKTYEDYDVRREFRDMLRTPYDSIRKDIVSAAASEICKHVKVVVENPIKEEQK